MYISSLSIHDFRAFQKPFNMTLGRYMTVISGLNGIGKSTILAILTNSSELKTSDGTLLNGSQFKGDFRDIVMYDAVNDTSGDKVDIYFKDLPSDTKTEHYVPKLTFRATKQKTTVLKTSYRKNKTTDDYKKHQSKEIHFRYRLIPKKEKGVWETNSKVKWPSYYLGLSRIYPVGETEDAKKKSLPDDIAQHIIKKHAQILSERFISEEDLKFQNLNIQNVEKSKSGIQTNEYGATSNSSGQDNLGQILLTLSSFEKLRESLGSNYHGGILAIDELDATLHPAAQNKLFDWLYLRSKELNLQIVFTTHSLSLLEHASSKINEKGVSNNDIKIAYLRTEPDKPGEIIESEDPKPEFFKYNLTQTYATKISFSNPVNVIMEDNVAREFCKLIFSNSSFEELSKVRFPEVNISWSHLLNLIFAMPNDFRDAIFILDPDKTPSDTNNELKNYLTKNVSSIIPNDPKGNLFTLPGTKSIEQTLWEFLKKLSSDSSFFNDEFILNHGFDKDRAIESQTKYQNDTNKFKHWFEDNIQYMSILEKYWILENKQIVQKFCENVYQSYKRINSSLEKQI